MSIPNTLMQIARGAPRTLNTDALQPTEYLEYVALKQEQATRIALRETALYANLAIAAAAFAVYAALEGPHRDEFFLVLPFVSFVMFWIYFNNDYYINFIGAYIANYISPRIQGYLADTKPAQPRTHASLVRDPPGKAAGNTAQTEEVPFLWETFHRRPTPSRWIRGLMADVVLLVSFVLLPVLALIKSYALLDQGGYYGVAWLAGVVAVLGVTFGITALSK